MPDPNPHHRRSPMEHERDAGPAVDTSPEAVERLARLYSGAGLRDDDLIAATLRALAADRDAALHRGIRLGIEAAGRVMDMRAATESRFGNRHREAARDYKAREAFHLARCAEQDAARIRALDPAAIAAQAEKEASE